MSGEIKLFYSRRRNREVNFGDDISPMLVAELTGRKVVHARVSGCDMAAIGSIIEMIAERRMKRVLHGRFDPVLVWGSGCLMPGKPISRLYMKPLALRGPRTAQRLGNPAVPFGDPGLLFDRLVQPGPEKKYRWGVIAHYTDADAPGLAKVLENTPRAVNIPVNAPPLETLQRIGECDFIASSSLHGLIAADCYGIPNLRLKFSANLEATDGKFHDYADPIGRSHIAEVAISDSGNLDDLLPGLEDPLSYHANIAPVADALEKALRDAL
ncbi:polysaccharide pyruvyl transferase family protein [Albibacillus kandeliae]|uniref:polysaccharide pyruvyl transferase family protein n=1 Tax=Albibacillus kandeliae TaxID=2174228 RepID=UPI000D689A2E|nr:polysaccharide pyruvyl transferase family protein [Albibacillus kandeliae]